MSIITAIATALPVYKHQQDDIANFMAPVYSDDEREQRKLKILYAKSGIQTRYSVIPDYSLPLSQRNFYPPTHNLEPFPALEQRMLFFRDQALPLAKQAIEKCIEGQINLKQITHLITVTCTGLSAPGLDIDLIQALNLATDVDRTSVNFMGCYAAIHALKQANFVCKACPDANVVIVCVELCTIHFQKIADIDNLTANMLFADGAAACLVRPDTFKQANNTNLKINAFGSLVALSGKNDMAWQLSKTGFLMTLSSYIPQLVKQGIGTLLHTLLKKMDLQVSDINHWAVHPGGKKILEAVETELALQNTDLESSYSVLKQYGNMSSVTILFVLQHMIENKLGKATGQRIFTVGFGPGLTMESILLENV